MRAADRQQVADASDRLEMLLRYNPDQLGKLRPDGRRTLLVKPLVVTYEISEQDRRVTIVSIRMDPSLRQP